jgi:sphingolipid 4-desaturase/C4-monooxygenase
MRDGFPVTLDPNPHIQRGKDIVRAHPEVKQYFGHYPLTGAVVVGVVGLQLAVAYLLRDSGWLLVLVAAYALGAYASHALFVLIHEAGHNLIAKTSTPNRLWGILCNVGQGVPTAISFRIFHGLHHSHLDEYDYDGDLAFRWEARLVGTAPLRKMVWLLLFPIIEIIRPLRIKKAFMDRWTVLNFAAIFASDALVWWLCGLPGLAYVVLSTLFGVGFHVVGARWVQEHYTFKPGQETYSYYGPLNTIAFNIGYHNEHHDLVRVPWVHLPKIKALAPEFYDHLYAHRSWTRVLWHFFFDEQFDLFARITRERSTDRAVAAA